MSASTEDALTRAAPEPEARAPLWSWPGLAFVILSALAAGAGLCVEYVVPSQVAIGLRHLPALQWMAAAQAGFILLIGPYGFGGPGRSIPACRHGGRSIPTSLLWFAARLLIALAACSPLYLAAGWFSDAVPADVLRLIVYLLAVGLAAWGLSLHVGPGAVGTAVGLFLALAGLGAPVMMYLLQDVAGAGSLDWLFHLSPLTQAYAVAGSRGGFWPSPPWATLLWPTVALAAVLAKLFARGPTSKT